MISNNGKNKNVEYFNNAVSIDKNAVIIELIALLMGIILIFISFYINISTKTSDNVWSVSGLGIGCSLIATAIANFILTFSAKKFNAEKFGIESIFLKRSQANENVYQDYIQSSKSHIWVMGTGLNRFLRNNKEVLLQAAQRGVEVKILILSSIHQITINNQQFNMLSIRKAEEDRAYTLRNNEDHTSLKKVCAEINEDITNSNGKKITVKEYCTTTGNMIFRIDDKLFVGPYIHSKDSGDVHTLFLSEGPLFNDYIEHFDKIWNDDRFCLSLQI